MCNAFSNSPLRNRSINYTLNQSKATATAIKTTTHNDDTINKHINSSTNQSPATINYF